VFLLVSVDDAEFAAHLIDSARFEKPVESVIHVGGALGDVTVRE
jgi:hypothetical protein